MTVLRYIIAFTVGYLFGNISFSNIMSMALSGKDIRTLGSGNAGATNILRNFGLKYAVVVFIGDAFKAVIASIIGCIIIGKGLSDFSWTLGFTQPQILVGGTAAVIGHNFPAFMNFKGGKGVSSSLGFLLVMNPVLGLIFIIIAAISNIKIKVYSIVSMSIMLLSAIVYTIFDANGDIYEISVLWFMFLLMVFMHRANIIRIFKGEEKKIQIFK